MKILNYWKISKKLEDELNISNAKNISIVTLENYCYSGTMNKIKQAALSMQDQGINLYEAFCINIDNNIAIWNVGGNPETARLSRKYIHKVQRKLSRRTFFKQIFSSKLAWTIFGIILLLLLIWFAPEFAAKIVQTISILKG